MGYRENYEEWLEKADLKTREELLLISGNEEEIKDRFYAPLSFGTAGLRGIMGTGLNRMNIYVVRHTTQALAALIKAREMNEKGVVVGYDSRLNSKDFAFEVCRVLVANRIKVYMFDELRPTAEVSYAILRLNAAAGVNITASHNPKEYNGYKLYWSDGIQISPSEARIISEERECIDMFSDVFLTDSSSAEKNIIYLDRAFDRGFLSAASGVCETGLAARPCRDLSVVYTPLFGAGYRLVPEILKSAGFKNIFVQKEQSVPNGEFPGIRTPNPEYAENLALAIETAKEQNSELVIGTDADADRIGVAVRLRDGTYKTLSGNQTGAILLEYILSSKKSAGVLPEKAAAVKTIVTTELVSAICKNYGVELYNVLTGFKYIGEKIDEFKKTGKTYIFGYEESYGYLPGDFARDKDSVSTALLICETAAYCKSQGKTLYDALCDLYLKYGYYEENTSEFYMQGLDGLEKMKNTMKSLRKNPPEALGGLAVSGIKDYIHGLDGLPASDVMYYILEDNTVVIVRPSGTEPKIKVYVLARGDDKFDTESKISAIKQEINQIYF